MKYAAAIIITTVPIMCMYPFVQKYFSQGVMIGAIKGEFFSPKLLCDVTLGIYT